MLSLPLVSPFPLGPSLGQGSLLRPGGHLLRCGGLLSRLLRPGGRLSRLLRPSGRLSRLLRPGGRLICQSHSTSPSTCQSHLTSQRSTQCPFTSQRSTQCPFTSLLSRLPCPGGLLSHWPHMDLALHSLPRFHRPPGLCRVCEASGSRSLGGGLCHESGCHSLQLHITHGLHLPSSTAHTHSRPPLHQSHSCHHSLI